MADAGFWGVMTIFGLGATLAFFFIMWATRLTGGEEYSEYQKEMEEWRKAHSVWHFFLMFPLIGKFVSILHWFVGPPLPKLRKNAEIEMEIDSEAYSPESTILVEE